MTHIIPFGTSEPQDFALLDAGAAINGTAIDVDLEIAAYAGGVPSEVDTPPTVAWLSAAAGTVRVTGTESLAVGTYLVRFKLTDAGDLIGFVPNLAKADIWRVVAIAAP
jgi:hypothetical protein